jgi:uncharacterized membrane protein
LKNNFLHTFTNLIKQLKVPVTESSALRYLESHPDEGSMLAYSDALNHFNIENAAIRVNQEQLFELPTPFIAFSNTNGGTFSLVKKLGNGSIEWLDTQKGWINDKLENFIVSWSGVVLLAEKDSKSGERSYIVNRNKEYLENIRIPAAIALISSLAFVLILMQTNLELNTNILLVLKLLGMVISGLLLVKSIDSSNSLVNKLCNSGSKISCQSILDSPAAKITSWFSWSDAGFIYFFGSFFSLLFSLANNQLIFYWAIQFIFSGIAILFSGYSLYYQGVKAKMWCTLCLGIVSVFVLESLVLIYKTPTFSFTWQGFSFVTLGFAVPIAFLLLFKSLAIKANTLKNVELELLKLKTNPDIFEALMAGQKPMLFIPTSMPTIQIGNPTAANTITMISNPLCSPCAHMHARIEKILDENENLKCNVIFISNTHENDPGGKFVRKLFALPHNLQAEALHYWFGRNDKNFEKWNEKYKENSDGKNNNIIQVQHLNWINDAEVQATPTLFYNGKKLPSMIKIEDLAYQVFSPMT